MKKTKLIVLFVAIGLASSGQDYTPFRTGTINDPIEGVVKMKAILDKNTCQYQYKKINQGHSWDKWRDLLGDTLLFFSCNQLN